MKSSRQIVAIVGAGALVLASTALGCNAQDDEAEAASSSATSALQASQHSGLTEGAIELEGADAADPEKAAIAVAERPSRGLLPAGCATKTRDGNKVRLVSKGCTGPFGHVAFDGVLEATFSKGDSNQLHVDIKGVDLQVNQRAFTYQASGDITYEGSLRYVTWHGDVSGTTKRGKEYTRHNELDIRADTAKKCLEISGTSTGTIGGFDLDITIDSVAVCKDQCPSEGSVHATVTGPAGRNRTMDIAFDGSSQARVKGFRGRSFTVDMACADGEAE